MNEPPDFDQTVDLPSSRAANEAASAFPTVPGYRVHREIARGGMGRVLAAHDLSLGRDVALKILLPGANADRFVRESKITARLPHPGIPPVHALGTLADHSPFLAMKLIAGQTLAVEMKSADRPRLLQVFTQVCQAVGFAHSRGVIHRDLKPTNVMVGAFGEVQVMDWGLAKDLASQDIPDESRSSEPPPAAMVGTDQNETVDYRASGQSTDDQTRAGTVLGTPAYMAPEQARGEAADAHADVFALGGILCAILTGKPPFTGMSKWEVIHRAAAGDLTETLARLDGCGADAELIALCRRCLSPNAANRPAHAAEVAELVAAYRAGVEQRLRAAELDRAATEAKAAEWSKRRRLWIGAAALLALTVIGGLGAVLEVQRRANAELAEKNAELTNEQAKVSRANTELAGKNTELTNEQAKVQARFELAQKAIRTFHTGVSEDVLLKQDQFKELRQKLLKEAAGFYAELEKLLEGQTDVRSRQALGVGYAELGAVTERIGSKQEALVVHRKALAVRRELAAVAALDAQKQLDVARSLRDVGILLWETGDPPGALAAFEESRNLAEQLGPASSTDDVRVVLAQSQHGIGILLGKTGKPAAGLSACEQGRRIRQELADANPEVAQFQTDLADSHTAVGWLLSETGKLPDALSAHEQGLAVRQKLVDDHPASLHYQTDLAQSHYNIGILLAGMGKPKESLAAHERARDIAKKLADAYPAVTQFQSSLAQSHNAVGGQLAETRKLPTALVAYKQGLAIRQKLADANPAVTQFQSDLAQSHQNIGLLLAGTGKLVEALAAHEQARGIRQKLVDANAGVTQLQSDLARSHTEIGVLHVQRKRFGDAFVAFDLGLAIRQKLSLDHPESIHFTRDLAQSHTFRGVARVRAGQSVGATADLRRAVELWAKDPNPTIDTWIEKARCLALLAGLSKDAKAGVSSIEAEVFAAQAVTDLRDAIAAGWDDFVELREPDWSALRDRADYKKLLADLKVGIESRGKP